MWSSSIFSGVVNSALQRPVRAIVVGAASESFNQRAFPAALRTIAGFVSRTLTFAVPAGVVAGVASYAAFEMAIAAGSSIDDSRTVATVVLLGIGLWIVGRVAQPIGWWRLVLLAAIAAGAVLAFTLEVGRFVYGLAPLDPGEWLGAASITALAIVVLAFALRISANLTLGLHRRARGVRATTVKGALP